MAPNLVSLLATALARSVRSDGQKHGITLQVPDKFMNRDRFRESDREVDWPRIGPT